MNLFQGGAKSIVIQISITILIFLLLSDNFFGGRSLIGGKTASEGPLPLTLWKTTSFTMLICCQDNHAPTQRIGNKVKKKLFLKKETFFYLI